MIDLAWRRLAEAGGRGRALITGLPRAGLLFVGLATSSFAVIGATGLSVLSATQTADATPVTTPTAAGSCVLGQHAVLAAITREVARQLEHQTTARPPTGENPVAFTGSFRGAKPSAVADPCVGPRGAPGQTGNVGSQGIVGTAGRTGLQGWQGIPGLQGLTGLQGFQGLPGPAGATGAVGANSALPGPAGLTGPQGPLGTTGPTGANSTVPGPVGLTGPEGLVGATGPVGANSTVAGPIGATGAQGATGANSVVPGPAGVTGAAGATGSTGTTGVTGPAGGITPNYAYVYNLTAQTVAIEAPVPFDSNGLVTPGITHVPGSPSIAIVTPGVYDVSFSVSGTEPGQFAVSVNGAVVPGSIYGSGAGTQQDDGMILLNLNAGDVIELENHSSSSAIGLASGTGGTQANANAAIVVEQIA